MERLTLTWTRPDGEEAVKVMFTYATPEEASDTLSELLDLLGVVRGKGGETHER